MAKGYRQLSLEDETFKLAEKYAKEEGFTSVASFVRYLIRSYPFIKTLRQMCEQGLIKIDSKI